MKTWKERPSEAARAAVALGWKPTIGERCIWEPGELREPWLVMLIAKTTVHPGFVYVEPIASPTGGAAKVPLLARRGTLFPV